LADVVYGRVRSTDPDKRSWPARLRARCAAASAAVRSRLQAERGSVLVEVLVGSVVLAVATIGILNGIDGAQSVGAKNKARSVQATLAQQDIERMRSMPITTLDNFTQTRTLNVAGADYTVVSRTDWVSDQTGSLVNCSNTNADADYLKLTSSVTSAASNGKTVTETGLLTPTIGQLSTTTGMATVQLTNRDGNPLSGVTVTLSGASNQSASTNSLGCAVFGYIPVGAYNVTIAGYVQVDSVSPATSVMQVYGARASFLAMQVDRPASLRANFVAPSGNSTIAASGMVWDRIVVKNANLTGGELLFTRGSKATSVDATNLYPFLDGVGVYAGDCDANDPSLYATNYFNPSAPRGWTALNPGDALRAVNVEMPTLRVTVRRTNTSTAFTSAKVELTPLDSGCTIGATGSQTFSSSTSARNFDLAVPFGRYTVCASTRNSTSSSSARQISTTVDLRTPVPPTPNRTTALTTGSTTGDCF
jgi:Tfp pilus assembly protein PilV